MTREEFLTQRLAERSSALGQLRGGLQDYLDGDWGWNERFKTKHDQCPHKKFQWEDCGACIDEYLAGLLAASNGER